MWPMQEKMNGVILSNSDSFFDGRETMRVRDELETWNELMKVAITPHHPNHRTGR